MQLNELRQREVALRGEERNVDHEREAAEREVLEASGVLTQVLADDGDSKAAMKRLEQAKAAAARPWHEIKEAARLKVQRAHSEVGRYAQQHGSELWADFRPSAEEAAAKVDRLLEELRQSIRALDGLDSEADALLKLEGRERTVRVPQRGLEGLYADVRRRLGAQSTPPPIPAEPAVVTIEPPAAEAQGGPRAA
ncbi:MAG: hypothetical protein ACR2ML_10015 [Solirubrobacteraceae bacterium]